MGVVRGLLGSVVLAAVLVVSGVVSGVDAGAAPAPSGDGATPVVARTDAHPLAEGGGRPSNASLPQELCADAYASSADPICVHWTTAPHNANAATEEQAELTLQTVIDVYDTYQAAGFHMPEADCDDVTVPCATKGGSPDIDIYLSELGDEGYYGYCSPSEPVGTHAPRANDTPAYCVLDNDFSAEEFGDATSPDDALRVTVAHEFFHAVQFAYDGGQPWWFVESTATWAESELYPHVADNAQFLPFSPLCFAGRPLNENQSPGTAAVSYGCTGLSLTRADRRRVKSDYDSLHMYGNWIFFRWLTDKIEKKDGTPPLETMRQIWAQLDTTDGHQGTATDAIGSVLGQHHLTWAKAYALFSADNLRARQTYAEPGHKSYPVAKPTAKTKLGPKKRSSKASFAIDHLASATERVRVGAVTKRDALQLKYSKASAVVLTVHYKNGKVQTVPSSGTNVLEVAAAARVRYADLTLVNGDMKGTRKVTLTMSLKRLTSAG